MKYLLAIPMAWLVLGSMGCGSSSDGTTGTLIEGKVRATTPVLTASLAALTRANAYAEPALMGDSWQNGSGNYEIFNLLRNYSYPADEGKIDMTNMYKALHEIKNKLNEAEPECEDKSFDAKTIAAPFPAFTGYNVTCGYNDGNMADTYAGGTAIGKEGTVTSIVYGWKWAGNQNGGSLGAVQARYDSSNESLNYEMVNCVNCGAGGDGSFTVRTHIQGDPAAHNFTVRTAIRNLADENFKTIEGKGVSQGTGGLMLFKFKIGSSAPLYYCMASDALSEEQFKAQTGATEVPSECSAIDLTSLTSFTKTDVPFAISDFTGSSILLSLQFAGTNFLKGRTPLVPGLFFGVEAHFRRNKHNILIRNLAPARVVTYGRD